jgi:hypothetical protein
MIDWDNFPVIGNRWSPTKPANLERHYPVTSPSSP